MTSDPSRKTSPRPSRLSRLLYRARTEGGSPQRQAAAVALGLYIGSSPFIGLHLGLSLGLGWLFRLNRLKVYLAANISNPLFAPFLYATEIQLGSWLRTGHVYAPGLLSEVRLRGLAIDVLIGSIGVGLTLAAVGGSVTYWILRRRGSDPQAARLVDLAAERYLTAGAAAWELAHGKLQMDPVYLQVLRDGVLPRSGTILDIGCGQGYMLALLAAARDEYRAGRWVRWPPPPVDATLVGIELRQRIASRARAALDGAATIETLDILSGNVPSCRAALVFDVLHMLPLNEQDRLLEQLRGTLDAEGVLVIREADRAGGWRFLLVRAGNWLRALFEGRPGRRFHFRTATEWEAWLASAGFNTRRAALGGSAPLANFLLYARRQ